MKWLTLSSETFSADNLLNSTIVHIEACSATRLSSMLKLTIREIEEAKKINYF